ncbi:hypothetical protein [Saccharothrix hoggarensis]|uniref:DUF4878 domain-containing protein n=1 Tax=Saccharothrix hoggarensis TaxID=913853 RepID=A0ABW3R1G2_9PSEU
MTYPQQPYGGQGPSEQFPGQTPGHGQPSWYGAPQPGGFGAPPPPPPRRNTAAVVTVVALVVLVLGGLGFTGFVAPGFFLGDGGTAAPQAPTAPSTTSSSVPPSADPERLLEAVVEAFGAQDAKVLEDVACPEAGSAVHKVVEDVAPFRGAELVATRKTSADVAVGAVEVATKSKPEEYELKVVRDGDTWCWTNISRTDVGKTSAKPTSPTSAPTDPKTPTAGGKPVDPAALAAVQAFLDSVNAGDAAKAKTQLCADGIKKPQHVDELVGHDPDLRINTTKDGITAGPKSFQLYLQGTAKGQKIDGHSGNVWVTNYDGPWCVHAFSVVVI